MADTLTNPMHVEVISPDGPIYRETGVEMVVARAADGEFAVMKNHLPLAAALEMCPVRIIKGGKEQKVAVFGGFLEIKDNQVNIVAPWRSWRTPSILPVPKPRRNVRKTGLRPRAKKSMSTVPNSLSSVH